MTRPARLRGWWWPVGLWLGACGISPSPGPVPLEGPKQDLQALAGEWSGRYWSEGSRHGTLTFRLRAGSDTARGEVNMSFAPALELYGERPEEDLSRAPCTTLDITIVRVRGATVRGSLAPYWDPDCDCRTRTVFEGQLTGDSVGGTFTSRRESSDVPALTGSWFVVRE